MNDVVSDLVLEQEGADVFYANGRCRYINREIMDWVRSKAAASVRKRSRICFHDSTSSAIHEMLIAHHLDTYVRPHKHFKTEASLLAMAGDAVVVAFTDAGEIDWVRKLSSAADEAPAFIRIPRNTYYAILVRSEWLVFLETMAGPFDRAASEFGAWSPAGETGPAIERYMQELRVKTRAF